MEENILTSVSDGVFRHGRRSDDSREVIGGVRQTPPAPQPLYPSAFPPLDGRRGGETSKFLQTEESSMTYLMDNKRDSSSL